MLIHSALQATFSPLISPFCHSIESLQYTHYTRQIAIIQVSYCVSLLTYFPNEIVAQEDKMASYSLLKAKEGQLAQGLERTKKDKLSKRTMRHSTTRMYFELYGRRTVPRRQSFEALLLHSLHFFHPQSLTSILSLPLSEKKKERKRLVCDADNLWQVCSELALPMRKPFVMPNSEHT